MGEIFTPKTAFWVCLFVFFLFCFLAFTTPESMLKLLLGLTLLFR